MKNLLAQLKTEDWVIVLAGVAILALALLLSLIHISEPTRH